MVCRIANRTLAVPMGEPAAHAPLMEPVEIDTSFVNGTDNQNSHGNNAKEKQVGLRMWR